MREMVQQLSSDLQNKVMSIFVDVWEDYNNETDEFDLSVRERVSLFLNGT